MQMTDRDQREVLEPGTCLTEAKKRPASGIDEYLRLAPEPHKVTRRRSIPVQSRSARAQELNGHARRLAGLSRSARDEDENG
jgi:hypothetical protein